MPTAAIRGNSLKSTSNAERQQNMTLHGKANNARSVLKSIVTQRPKNQENEEDGAPPTQPPALPKGLLPDYSGKGPRLQDKLATMEPQVLQEAALNILQEAKTNESAREELKNLMLDNTSGVFML